VRTNTIYIALSYKHTPYTGVAYTNYLASSLNISVGKTLVPSSSVLFTYLSIGRKLYYNSSLSLNRSIDPTSISL
jgi:hypothetical protein